MHTAQRLGRACGTRFQTGHQDFSTRQKRTMASFQSWAGPRLSTPLESLKYTTRFKIYGSKQSSLSKRGTHSPQYSPSTQVPASHTTTGKPRKMTPSLFLAFATDCGQRRRRRHGPIRTWPSPPCWSCFPLLLRPPLEEHGISPTGQPAARCQEALPIGFNRLSSDA